MHISHCWKSHALAHIVLKKILFYICMLLVKLQNYLYCISDLTEIDFHDALNVMLLN